MSKLFVLSVFVFAMNAFSASNFLGAKSYSRLVSKYGQPTTEQIGYVTYTVFSKDPDIKVYAVFVKDVCHCIEYWSQNEPFSQNEIDSIMTSEKTFGFWYQTETRNVWSDKNQKKAYAILNSNKYAIKFFTFYGYEQMQACENRLDRDVQRAANGEDVNEIARQEYYRRKKQGELQEKRRQQAAEAARMREMQRQTEELAATRRAAERQAEAARDAANTLNSIERQGQYNHLQPRPIIW
jgi:hypothetical protein